MNDSKEVLDSDELIKPSNQKHQAGTLLHYFQKKVIPARQPHPNEKGDVGFKESPKSNTDQGNEGPGLALSSKESESSRPPKSELPQPLAKVQHDGNAEQGLKCENCPSENRTNLVDLTGKPQCTNGTSGEPNQDVDNKKNNTNYEETTGKSPGTKKLSLNPFQILMESGKKKGVWNKPTTKNKELVDLSSEEDCAKEEAEAVVSPEQSHNAKFFSIFSKKTDKDVVCKSLNGEVESNAHEPPCTTSNSGNKADTTRKHVESEKSARLSNSQNSSSRKSKPSKTSDKSSSGTITPSKRKRRSSGAVQEESEEPEARKCKDRKSIEGKKSGCSPHGVKRDSRKSGEPSLQNGQKDDTPSNLRKSRFKVVDDSDFEPDDLRSGKRKDQTPSKSQRGGNKRPRTDSHSRCATDSSTKSAVLSTAQKLVKKSRDLKKRSGDGSKRTSGRPDKPRRQILSEQADIAPQPPADTSGPGAPSGAGGSPRRRSARASSRPERPVPPSDSELEFTPSKKPKSRRAAGSSRSDVRLTSGKKTGRRASHGRRAAEYSDSELEATPVKKPGSRRRRQCSGSDIEVLSTSKAGRRPGRPSGRAKKPSVEEVEVLPEKKPERRSARARRPVVRSDSEVEVTPVKKPGRRPRSARGASRPSIPSDSEVDVTPVKKPGRRSARSRRAKQLSDSEVELSPMKRSVGRGGGRRAAAADELEVVLVRSRSAGARPGRPGVDAFQLMRRGGRPAQESAQQTAANAARRAFLDSGVPESLQLQAEVARRLEESLTPLFPEVSHVHQRGDEKPVCPADDRPLLGGLRWRTEPAPTPIRPAAVRNLIPVPASQPVPVPASPSVPAEGPAASQVAPVTAGGDNPGEASSVADGIHIQKPSSEWAAASSDPPPAVSGAVPSDRPAAATPRVARLSPPECSLSLRRLLSDSRESGPGAALWTHRYRPRQHASFVGAVPAEALQEWLADWTAPGAAWDEGSDEPAGDGTVLLLGPTGCGKTSAVYAAAAQLGFQVLEVSASSRRSGRHLSSQLSEATQSQRVSVPGGTAAAAEPARSLLLLEDVQLASEEQDDGFLAAAASLAAAAKRPVVLTSSDPAVVRTRLLRSLPHRLLRAAAPPAAALRRELTLVALAQGWLLPERAATTLAEGGDIRRALLQLQWLCEAPDGADGAEQVDTRQALTEAQLGEMEEFVDALPDTLRVVRPERESAPIEPPPQLETVPAGRRQSGWRPPVREVREATAYDGQKQRRWRLVDPDLFSDEDDTSPADGASPAPADGQEPAPREERALLAASVAALAQLCEQRSACDALLAPADRCVMSSWWQSRPEADMTEAEQPRCVTEERADQLGREAAAAALRAAGGRCADQLRAARAKFAACSRPEPAAMQLPQYDEDGVREVVWAENARVTPAVPSLLLSRRALTADLLPSIRRMCRLECGRRARDGGRTRRFLHYFDQTGLHAVPSDSRSEICTSLM